MSDQIPSSPLAPDWEALARYHAGESPADEARRVATWLAGNAQDAAMLATLDEAVERAIGVDRTSIVAGGRALDVEAALRAVKARRDAEDGALAERGVLAFEARAARGKASAPRGSAARQAAPARRTRAWWVAGGLAAAAALALLVRGPGDAGVPADSPQAVATGTQVIEPGREYATAVGRRDSLRLPDGTRVMLAPGSRLAVASTFGEAAREVTLDGQALFTAVHDDARPFTVRAGNAIVRDIGTVFSVRTDGQAAGGTVVEVTEGRVALRAATRGTSGNETRGVELVAGDRGALSASGAVTAERGVVSHDDVAWAGGTLTYRAAPVSLVAADLRRWYGLELRIDSTLAARRLTATFVGDPTEQVVQVVALALGATVERDGNVVTLRSAGGARR
jgi:transmembrane sensor